MRDEEEEERRRKGGIKKPSTDSYIAPASTIVPPLFLGTSPLIMVSAFVVSPKTHLGLSISSYFTGNFYLCMATTYIHFIHQMHVLWKV